MFHAISGWLTRHARRNREQLVRDNEFAAMNGWQSRPVNRLGTWGYRDPRFTARTPIRAAQAAGTARPTWAQAAISVRISDLPLVLENGSRRRCSRWATR
jgi:hypothetical protein